MCRRKNDVRYEAGQERMLPTREDVAAEDWAPKQRFVRVTTDLAFPINRDLEGAAASILKIKAAMTDLLA